MRAEIHARRKGGRGGKSTRISTRLDREYIELDDGDETNPLLVVYFEGSARKGDGSRGGRPKTIDRQLTLELSVEDLAVLFRSAAEYGLLDDAAAEELKRAIHSIGKALKLIRGRSRKRRME